MLKRVSLVGVVAMASLNAVPAVAQAQGESGWRIASSSPDFPRDDFSDIAVTGPDDAWAVGSAPCCEIEQQKLSHWDGTNWRPVTPPAPPEGTRYAPLTHVGASSPSNVWAFGMGADDDAFVHHWNGTAWHTSAFERGLRVQDTAVLGPRSTWFVGARWTGTGEEPIAQHHNGQGWSRTVLPGTPQAMSASGNGNVWAIGSAESGGVISMRWTGSSWKSLPLPKPALEPGVNAYPGDILALGPRNVWATAVLGKGEGVWPGSVLYHWNGMRWRQVKVDAPQDSLVRLASDGRGGLWIVSAGIHPSAYLLHYSRGRLTRQAAPIGTGTYASIEAISRVPGTRSLMAAGHVGNEEGWAATVYRYDPA
ncbi:hypothetical protein [Actinomadura sp. 9N407]|uniref:hypothetical protein n=1 Tax=Actinomadura sp. 9N407 TaxID=3375154 RepID=UPI00378CDBB8